jgi:hypothetical protein
VPLSSTRTDPCAEVAPPSFAAFVVILATSTTASINGSVVGMFEMPFVPNVELAQQCLDHGSLRFESQCSVLLMMAFPPSRGSWQTFLDRRTPKISPQSDATVQGCTAVQRSGYVSRLAAGDPDGYTMRCRVRAFRTTDAVAASVSRAFTFDLDTNAIIAYSLDGKVLADDCAVLAGETRSKALQRHIPD